MAARLTKKPKMALEETKMSYDHYVAVDWSQRNMAIARMTAKSDKIECKEAPSDVNDIKAYLKNLTE